jgi:hypothetical protein
MTRKRKPYKTYTKEFTLRSHRSNYRDSLLIYRH